MSTQIRGLAWGDDGDPPNAVPTTCTDYTFFTDEELSNERDRHEAELDRPTGSLATPLTARHRTRIELEVESMTAELRRRARSRHPSSRALNDRIQPLRLVSGPSNSD